VVARAFGHWPSLADGTAVSREKRRCPKGWASIRLEQIAFEVTTSVARRRTCRSSGAT
jgi:hypothetical protein